MIRRRATKHEARRTRPRFWSGADAGYSCGSTVVVVLVIERLPHRIRQTVEPAIEKATVRVDDAEWVGR